MRVGANSGSKHEQNYVREAQLSRSQTQAIEDKQLLSCQGRSGKIVHTKLFVRLTVCQEEVRQVNPGVSATCARMFPITAQLFEKGRHVF